MLNITYNNALNLIFLSFPHQERFTRVSPVIYTVTSSPESWQVRRVLLLDLPTDNINSITTMASNASDDGQMNTSTLSTARSNPTVPTNLQHASDYSLDGNTNASTTDPQPDGNSTPCQDSR